MRLLTLILAALVGAVHGFFDFGQMFGGGGGGGAGGGPGGGHQQQAQNAPSDPGAYQRGFDGTYCENYLCPDTLACVHFPHHCPCAWEAHEEKFETGEGHRICVSKGGRRAGDAARKVELARKGLL